MDTLPGGVVVPLGIRVVKVNEHLTGGRVEIPAIVRVRTYRAFCSQLNERGVIPDRSASHFPRRYQKYSKT